MARIRANNASGGGGGVLCGDFTPTTSDFYTIDTDFIPTKVVFWLKNVNGNHTQVIEYNISTGTIIQWYESNTAQDQTSAFSPYITLDSGKVKYKAASSAYATKTWFYAVRE